MFSHTNHPRIVIIQPRFTKKHEEHLEGVNQSSRYPSFDPTGAAQTTPIRIRGC